MPAPREEIARFLGALRRRLRVDRTTGAALAASVVLLLALTAGLIAGATPRLAVLAAAIGLGLAAGAAELFRSRAAWSVPAATAHAEARLPALRNHLVTALELERNPDRASARMHERVLAHAAGILRDASLDAVQPVRPMWTRLAVAACALGGSALVWLTLPAWSEVAVRRSPGRGAAASTRAAGIDRLQVTITPPAYVGSTPRTLTDPARIDALIGSTVAVQVESGAAAVRVELGDAGLATRRTGQAVHAQFTVAGSALLTVSTSGTDGDRRLLPVVMRPDTAPEVVIDAPQKDLLLDRATGQVRFAAHARDDLGLASLTLHYTKVTGSGEQYGFVEGELPLALSRRRPEEWHGEIAQPLAALGLQEGDLLVYFARARDRRPGAEPTVSDSYVIEIGRPRTAIAGGFAIPPEEDKAAVSLSALIVKTERLHATRPRLPQPEVAERSSMLAIEQRMVRTETLFLMGAHGEVEDEEEEAEHSHEIQEGRLENRGQADLRLATRLMSEAERSLLLIDTAGALTAQRAALAALQRALSKQRYFLRTLPVRSQIDLTRRLSGELGEARSWERRGGPTTPDETLAAVRALLGEVGAIADPSPASESASGSAATSGPRDGADLARRVLAIDPASATLQAVARDLDRLAREPRLPPAERRRLLAAVTGALQQLAAHVRAVPAPPAGFSTGALRGALNERLRADGGGR